MKFLPVNKIFNNYLFGLILLFTLSFLIRIIGMNWDGGYLFHPDERAIFMHVYDINFSSLSRGFEFFDSNKSSLNPNWFNYGSFPIYFLKLSTNFVGIFYDLDIYDFRFVGRFFSILIDCFSVILITIVSRYFVGEKWSLLTGVFLAFSLINIQNSHFFTTDIFITSFIIILVIISYKNIENPSVTKTLMLALFFSIGLAFKFSFLPSAIPIIISYFFSFTQNKLTKYELFKLLAILFFSILLFLAIFQPYMFLDHKTYLSHILEQSKMVRGIHDFPYTRQYSDTTIYIYQFVQIFKWGLGPILGTICYLGFFYFIFYTYKHKSKLGLMILLWFIVYALINGNFQVKFTRYFLPLIPFLLLFGTIFLKDLNDKLSNLSTKYINIRYLLLFLILVPTIHFTVSFINGIYMTEHPAVLASKWLEENNSSKVTIVQDHWEESIPGSPKIDFVHERLELYNTDSYSKFEKIFSNLSNADYYVIFSNRLYGTIPRLEERYPATSLFYDKLFDEELGFEIVNFQKQSMNFLSINYSENYFERININKPKIISDYENKFAFNLDFGFSDESFSVYDHPNVIIFQNIEKYSKEELFEISTISNQSDFFQPQFFNDDPYKKYQNNDDLDQINLFKSQMFLSENNSFIKIFVWVFIITMLGFVSVPFFYKLFINFSDFGFSFYKFFGLISFSFIIWILSSMGIIDFRLPDILAIFLLFSIFSIVIFLRNKNEILFYIKKSYKQIITVELIFFLLLVIGIVVRFLNPDLWHPHRGGEKPMDLAYLNAIVRSFSMPPYDPWFSGYTLNYYYFGQFMVALLIKLTGIPSAISYNLAIPTFFAYSGTIIFGFSSSFVYLYKKARDSSLNWFKSPLFIGIFSIFSILIFGNFDGLVQLFNIMFDRQDFFDYWRSTRLISMNSSGLEINEFPFFTFLFADLHAHLLSIPIMISIISVSFIFYYQFFENDSKYKHLAILSFLALLTGCIQGTNTWDYPLSLFIVLVSIFFSFIFLDIKKYDKFKKIIFYSLFYFIMTKILFYNFDQNFIMPEVGISLSNWKTPIFSIVQISFLPIAIILLFTIIYFKNLSYKKKYFPDLKFSLIKNKIILLLLLIILFMVILFFLNLYTIILFSTLVLIVLFVAVTKLFLFESDSKLFLWITLLLVVGLSIPIFTDIFVMNDDINRMNTVFKFHFQSWILLNLGASLLIPLAFQDANKKIYKNIFSYLVGILIILGLIYPIYSLRPRILDRFNNEYKGLEGDYYMKAAKYSQTGNLIDLSTTYDATKWINNNINGNPVIVEASKELYSWSSNVSINTGLPAVLGWDWHQKQQRSLNANAVNLRKKQIEEFYTTNSEQFIEDFLNFYSVKLIIFGPIEKNHYPDFDTRLKIAMSDRVSEIYSNNGYTIYEYEK